ncbi:discoidin domain-containing protein [Chitinophaga pendula]|uniref:discoidin domain-containing protein n=1 Tax=Chitinophaga TaxID=79328 RepID=UPI000BAEA358|nr:MULTISPECIES: discoidin domain-containing protein [Chitinophaga]ASZ12444.1 hypothetical protein CK934_16490 [Chitinophaga sp. MD30]UCJ09959.1 discoidin domain-containing protein [Chitinophaga pendula]
MKKVPLSLLATFLLWATVSACKRDVSQPSGSPSPHGEQLNLSNSAYHLNIVYFVPSDMDTLIKYRERISGIMLQGQRFYGKWMQHYGYGNRSFGLLPDSTGKGIKIIVVKGKQTKDKYPYEGGGNIAIGELNSYFAANPAQKTSEHTLVIMPASTYAADGDPGGVPFYGLGRWCFALDYKEMDTSYLGTGGVLGNRATKWIGGLMHELGHGLNLPHNKEKVSEAADTSKGTALMGSGNYTYGKSPTFLTAASTAILNNSQTFRTTTVTDLYGSVSVSMKSIKAQYLSGNIEIKAKFTNNKPVNNVILYNDPEGGNDYDAVPWVVKPVGDSFNISMPINELHKKEGNYSLRIRFLFENGSLKELSYPYSFVNNVPVIDISTKDELDKSTWKIVSVNSEEDDGKAVNLLDNNPQTVWHTQWKQVQPAHPHHVVVDMQAIRNISGISFLQRENLSGALKDISIYTSADNTNWALEGNYILKNVNTIQYITLNNPKSVRYFKIVTASNYYNDHYAVLAECGAF